MAPTPHSKLLLVEGRRDWRLLPELLERGGVAWPSANPPIHIKVMEGVEQLLKPANVSASYKSSGLQRLGVVADADDLTQRWAQLCAALPTGLPPPPKTPPTDGLILEAPIRFGAWLMPDNQSHGMAETLVGTLAAQQTPQLWRHACDQSDAALQLPDSDFKQAHLDKARIHAWLAWRDEPGSQLHEAFKHNLLSTQGVAADRFVDWCCKLFDLTRTGGG